MKSLFFGAALLFACASTSNGDQFTAQQSASGSSGAAGSLVSSAGSTGAGGAGSGATSGGSSGTASAGTAGDPTACATGDTRQCVGPGACAGGQMCTSGAWSTCDCGTAGAGGSGSSSGSGGQGTAGNGGTSGGAGAAGSAGEGGASSGAGGEPQDAGTYDPCSVQQNYPTNADCDANPAYGTICLKVCGMLQTEWCKNNPDPIAGCDKQADFDAGTICWVCPGP